MTSSRLSKEETVKRIVYHPCYTPYEYDTRVSEDPEFFCILLLMAR